MINPYKSPSVQEPVVGWKGCFRRLFVWFVGGCLPSHCGLQPDVPLLVRGAQEINISAVDRAGGWMPESIRAALLAGKNVS
jgi:hypothetical protein